MKALGAILVALPWVVGISFWLANTPWRVTAVLLGIIALVMGCGIGMHILTGA